MVSVGDEAPDFTAPLANGDVDEVTLSEALADAPVVLAFFPGAFTSGASSSRSDSPNSSMSPVASGTVKSGASSPSRTISARWRQVCLSVLHCQPLDRAKSL